MHAFSSHHTLTKPLPIVRFMQLTNAQLDALADFGQSGSECSCCLGLLPSSSVQGRTKEGGGTGCIDGLGGQLEVHLLSSDCCGPLLCKGSLLRRIIFCSCSRSGWLCPQENAASAWSSALKFQLVLPHCTGIAGLGPRREAFMTFITD